MALNIQVSVKVAGDFNSATAQSLRNGILLGDRGVTADGGATSDLQGDYPPTAPGAPSGSGYRSGADRHVDDRGADLPAGKPDAGGRGWWTSDRERHAVDYLMHHAGLSEVGARGVVSRWKNVEASGGPSEVNRIGATGVAQWLGPRRRGVVRGDFEGQLAHAAAELNTSERAAGDVLRRARTPEEAAIGASMYERAEGYNRRTGRDYFTTRTRRGIPGVAGASGASK